MAGDTMTIVSSRMLNVVLQALIPQLESGGERDWRRSRENEGVLQFNAGSRESGDPILSTMSLIERLVNLTGGRRNVDDRIPRKVDEGLMYQMKQDALESCKDILKPYAECCTDNFLSVMWACRSQLKAANECLKQHTSDEVLKEYRERWLESQSEH